MQLSLGCSQYQTKKALFTDPIFNDGFDCPWNNSTDNRPIFLFLSIRQKWKMSRNFSNLLVNGGQFQSPKGCPWKSMIFYKTTKIFPSYFNNLIYDNHTIAVQKQNVRLFFKCCRSVNFEMSFWCHHFD